MKRCQEIMVTIVNLPAVLTAQMDVHQSMMRMDVFVIHSILILKNIAGNKDK